jgi:hypothetical protein
VGIHRGVGVPCICAKWHTDGYGYTERLLCARISDRHIELFRIVYERARDHGDECDHDIREIEQLRKMKKML